MKVLVREKIGESGVQLLRDAGFDVELGMDWSDGELEPLGGVVDDNANVVTAIALPDGIDGGKVPKLMRDRYAVTIAGGQGKLKGRIARIAHCGYFGAFDIIVTISALEMTLRELGHEAEPGAGVAAAQRVFADAGVALHA